MGLKLRPLCGVNHFRNTLTVYIPADLVYFLTLFQLERETIYMVPDRYLPVHHIGLPIYALA